ncbi:hypothetical protein [Acinetobacter sp. YH12126]|uniref:hypothetical protein n=1 Tax=Acinetobacter sp. YH12126 TaxID=2601111 RepID=UPI0015D1775D|nr:hypothetical protein [Acinetobacter sp. YH12126]
MRLFVLFFIFMVGCSNTDVNDSVKKSIKLSYILDMKNRIFSEYKLTHDGDVVAAYSTTSIFYIAEKNFSETDYSGIKKKLIENDWKFIHEVNGKDIYCTRDNEKSLTIARPRNGSEEFNNDNTVVIRGDKQWNIGFYYGTGIAQDCKL